jgi:hypothetical protein
MTNRLWRTAFASVIGTSHVKTGSLCQDAGGCVVTTTSDGSQILVAAVSDGAGTASRSDVGSDVAVQRFLQDFSQAAGSDEKLLSIDNSFVDHWLDSVREELAFLAADAGCKLMDYSCTILGAAISPSSSVYLQIGDGAIVVGGGDGEYSWIFWPQHGEYANSTNFLTQENAKAIKLFESGPSIDEIALFSDGIERLVLNLSTRTVHSPSFRPIFEWLMRTDGGAERQPSPALTSYLSSEHVNRRTDDDKTLVMATRVMASI